MRIGVSKSKRQFLLSLASLSLISLAFLAAVSPIIQQAHAVTPTVTNLAFVKGTSTAVGSFTLAITLTATTTVVIGTSTASSISTITNTPSALTWQKVTTGTIACNAFSTACFTRTTEEWYALTGTASGATTLTLTLSASVALYFADAMQISVPTVPAGTAKPFTSYIGSAPSSTTTPNPTTVTLNTNVVNSAAGDVVIAVAAHEGCGAPTATTCTAGAGNANQPTVNLPLSSLMGVAGASQPSAQPAPIMYFQTGYVAYAAATNSIYSGTYPIAFNSVSATSQDMIAVDFTQSSANAPSCPNGTTFGATLGGIVQTNTGAALTSNQTYYYITNTGTVSTTINSVVIAIKNVTSAANGARLLVGVYISLTNVVGGFSNVFPGTQQASFTWTLSTNTNPQTFTWNPNISVPPLAEYAIAIGTSHNGAFIYTTSSAVTTNYDTGDVFLTPGKTTGQLPLSITQTLVATTPWQFSVGITSPCTVPVVVAGGGATTTTATVTGSIAITGTVFSTVNTIGPSFFTTDNNWPIFFLILLMPAVLFLSLTKSLAGGLLGLMVGAVIGVMMGILPSALFIGIIISMIAIAFVTRERGS